MGVTSFLYDPGPVVERQCDLCSASFEIHENFPISTCDSCMQERQAAEAEAERKQRLRSIWDGTRVPEFYEWCSFQALEALPPAEQARRVKDPTGIERAKAAHDAKRVVLAGPAGVGKTVLATCLLRSWNDRGIHGAFVDSFELATARAKCRLGDEALEVERATAAPVLVLDDLLAKGGPHDAAPDVLHARHARQKTTIITTGFSMQDVKNKLGDGIARRVYEGATIIELQPAKRAA